MKKINIKFTNRLINHGPLLVVSAQYNGKETYTPIAWNMPVLDMPPLVAISVSKSNYVNSLIKKSKEFSLNILEKQYVNEILDLGKVSGKDVNKLELVKITPQKCKKINADYLKEAAAVIECKLFKTISILDIDIFIGESVYCQANDKFENGFWTPDKIKTIHHLGNKIFVTTEKLELFN